MEAGRPARRPLQESRGQACGGGKWGWSACPSGTASGGAVYGRSAVKEVPVAVLGGGVGLREEDGVHREDRNDHYVRGPGLSAQHAPDPVSAAS